MLSIQKHRKHHKAPDCFAELEQVLPGSSREVIPPLPKAHGNILTSGYGVFLQLAMDDPRQFRNEDLINMKTYVVELQQTRIKVIDDVAYKDHIDEVNRVYNSLAFAKRQNYEATIVRCITNAAATNCKQVSSASLYMSIGG